MKLITKAIQSALNKMGKYSQDGKGKDAKVIARYFRKNATWYVLEKAEGSDVFGLVDLGFGFGFEYGYFSMDELEQINKTYLLGVERDLSVKPLKQTLAELMGLYGEQYPL